MIALLIVMGVSTIDKIVYIEKESSSYTKTTFDYLISSPNEEQIIEINKLDSVDKTFPCYTLNNAFTQNTKTREIFLLLSDNLANYDISLFNDKTLIKGSFDENGLMLDEVAAKALHVNVGDEIAFSILGNSFRKTVKGIYLGSTYSSLTSGIALCKFSNDIKNAYTPKAYGFSFVKTTDKVAFENDLKDYAGEGNVALSYDEWALIYGGIKDEATKQNEYQAYRTNILNASKKAGNQVASKNDSYLLIKDKLNSTVNDKNRDTIIVSISSFVLFLLVNIIFIIARRKDDKIEMLEGKSFNKIYLSHILNMLITGALSFLIPFVVLFVVAINTYFLSVIVPTILIITLPTIASVLLLLLFDFIYIKILYSNNSK